MKKPTIATLTTQIEELRQQLHAERGSHLTEVKLLQDELASAKTACLRIIAKLRDELVEARTNQLPAWKRERILRILEVGRLSDLEIAQKVNVTADVVGLVKRSIGGGI